MYLFPKNILLLLVFAGIQTCVIPSGLKAMEENPFTPKKNAVLFNPAIKPEIVTSLNRALSAEQAEVAVDSFILSDSKVINILLAIEKKHPQSVTVHVHESNAHNKKTIEMLRAAGITVDTSHQHAKRLLIQFKQLDEQKWHTHSLCGSYNLTGNAAKNEEMMIFAVNDSPDHRGHKHSHIQGKKRDRTLNGTEVLHHTPDKKLVVDNATHDLHASIAPRIDNTTAGDTIYFASMNYGDPTIHTALLNAAQRNVLVQILLDTDATTQKNIPLLDELNHHGAHIVFPRGRIKKVNNQQVLKTQGIFHQKYVIRKSNDNLLSYISTANATQHAQADFNIGTYYPAQDDLALEIIRNHLALSKTGITYQEFKKSGATLPQKNKSKKANKLFDDSESGDHAHKVPTASDGENSSIHTSN